MAFDTLDVGTLDVFNPLVGGALVIPKGLWEPGTASIHKLHCGQGAMATPFAASLVVGPSLTSPLSINSIGLEQLTGLRNCFGSDIKIGSNISLGALDVSYNGVNSELNGIKSAAVPEWNTVAPKFDANAFTMDLKSPAGKLSEKWTYNGTPLDLLHSHSDVRLKKDIEPLVGSLDKVLQLQGVSFTWNRDTSFYVGRLKSNDIGLIAQDVEKIAPELVIETEINGVDFKVKNVDYSRLTPLLVEAIKEQQKQIEELKQRIADLEANK